MSGFRVRGCSALSHFANDKNGGVAIIFALMTVALCLFVGAGVDIGRWLHARQQTISAMDAGVLAGGRALQLNPNDVSGAIAAAQKFYIENTQGRLPLLTDTITFNATDNNTAFTASGNGYISTPLLGFVNIPKLPLLDTAGAEYSKAELAVGGSSDASVEIALMADVTGSMCGPEDHGPQGRRDRPRRNRRSPTPRLNTRQSSPSSRSLRRCDFRPPLMRGPAARRRRPRVSAAAAVAGAAGVAAAGAAGARARTIGPHAWSSGRAPTSTPTWRPAPATTS